MKCRNVKKSLSAFMDDALDPGIKKRIKNHLTECSDCRKEFAALQSMVEDLKDFHPVKAPDGFLEELKNRQVQRFSFKRTMKKLFVPFSIKIPIQLVAATAVGFMIFGVIHSPDVEKALKTPEKIKKEAISTGDSLKLNETIEERMAEPALPKPVLKDIDEEMPMETTRLKARQPSLKKAGKTQFEKRGIIEKKAPMIQEESDTEQVQSPMARVQSAADKETREVISPVEITIILNKKNIVPMDQKSDFKLDKKKVGFSTEISAGKGQPFKSAREKEIRHHAESDLPDETRKPIPVKSRSEKSSTNDTINEITHLVDQVNGQIILTPHDSMSDKIKFIIVKIPTKEFEYFIKKLEKIGDIKNPPKPVDFKEHPKIQVKIHFRTH